RSEESVSILRFHPKAPDRNWSSGAWAAVAPLLQSRQPPPSIEAARDDGMLRLLVGGCRKGKPCEGGDRDAVGRPERCGGVGGRAAEGVEGGIRLAERLVADPREEHGGPARGGAGDVGPPVAIERLIERFTVRAGSNEGAGQGHERRVALGSR